jgi:hypothetical protein
VEVVYILTTSVVKLSIGVFLLRIATAKRYIYIIWGSLVMTIIFGIVCFFLVLFHCQPVEYTWNRTMDGGTCTSPKQVANVAFALSVMTIVVDWLYALLPIPIIWSLQMNRNLKLSVAFVLGLGVL